MKITRHEFPYDIGIWANLKQGMGGSSNALAWFWPFAASPATSGTVFESNGFNDAGLSWPPPDPDRIPRRSSRAIQQNADEAFVFGQASGADAIREFKERQARDFERQRQMGSLGVARRRPFSERYNHTDDSGGQDYRDGNDDDGSVSSGSGEEGWMNEDGERLRDYGVDEDVEFYDHDDISLGELLRRRRAAGRSGAEDGNSF